MIQCSKCNAEIPRDSLFCPNCGVKVEAVENSNTEAASTVTAAQPNRKISKNIIIPILIIGIILLILVFPKSKEKPEKVVMTFFESIDNIAPEEFLDTLSSSLKKEALYEMNWEMAEVVEGLDALNGELSYELGENWIKDIKPSLTFEEKNNAVVSIFVEGERLDFELIKENKKWKIHDFPW